MENVKKEPKTITNPANLFKFCPTCKATLKDRDTLDILIKGLVCENRHRFFVPLEGVKSSEHKGAFLKLQSSQNTRDEIAIDWLTNSNLRKHLNNSVAETLRVFLEIRDNLYDGAKQEEAAKLDVCLFCPLCGEKPTGYDIPKNVYVIGYRCKYGHQYGSRGYRLSFGEIYRLADESPAQLCLDLDFLNLRSFTNAHLTKSESRRSIAPQVLDILKQYADEFLKDDPDTTSS